MNPNKFNQLVKECIQEVLAEARRICAWCNTDMGEFEGERDTHGMCQSCYEKQIAKLNLTNPNKQYSNPLPPEPPSITEQDKPANKVCLYCNKVYGQTSNPRGRDSHGICPSCASK